MKVINLLAVGRALPIQFEIFSRENFTAKKVQKRHHRQIWVSALIFILSYFLQDNYDQNQNMILTKIVITKFHENFYSCLSEKLR